MALQKTILSAVPGNAGRPGIDAPPANQGEHAGIIQVEILRSERIEGGILVRVVKQKGSKTIAPETEIAPRCKLHFTAIGGNGESGRIGGDGENGTTGEAGTPATRDSEATEGGPGGVGGNAGSGSDGANGGNGGTIQLIIDENDVELLYGISCDVMGGQGGSAGSHGKPGHGGKGGDGGTSVVWEDAIDHRYKCTSSCIGRSTTTAVLPNQRDATLEMFRRFQEETSRQSPLNRAMTRTLFAANRATPVETNNDRTQNQGVCRCRGGGGNCPGCETIPIYKTFSRPAGRNGPDGANGGFPRTPTVQGMAGQVGRLSVVIRKKNGQGLEGTSCFGLKLVEFDVEDGNADGIFEPGEDIFVRRIQIHNPGGVVSPIQHIPCRLSVSDCITNEVNVKGRTHLPTSIPPGSTKTSTGEIQARLSTITPATNFLPPYAKESSISLNATIPWTSLPVEDFSFTRSIKVEFPIEIRDIRIPTTIISGSKSKITWKLFNKSSRTFGISKNYNRYAKVVVQLTDTSAEVQDHNRVWGSKSTLTAAVIEPRSAIDMSQNFRVGAGIIGHYELDVSVQLFLSSPQQIQFTQEPVISEMQLVETHNVKVKVAPGHSFSPEDDVLIVTNSGTRHRDITAITDFLQSTLSLNLSVWNASTYGGLVKQDSGEQHVESILSSYGGRTVILLANPFELVQDEQVTATSLCDPLSVLAANQSGTNCMLFGFSNSEGDRAILDSLFRPIEGQTSSWTQNLPAQLRHETSDSLIESFSHSNCGADRCHIMAVHKVRLKSREKNMAQSARDLASKLHHDLPSYHFNICMIPRQPSDEGHVDGHLLVQIGLSRAAPFLAAHAEILRSNDRIVESQINLAGLRRRPTSFKRAATTLTAHDKLTLLGALPVATRMEILDQEKRELSEDDAGLVELSIERQIDAEVQSLAKLASKVKLEDKLRDDFLRESLPTMSRVIDHVQHRKYLSSETRRILAYCFASSKPQNKGAVLVERINPFAQTRKQIRELLQQSLGREKDFKIDGLLALDDRRVSSTLAMRINKVTGQALYFQEQSSYSPLQSLCNNDILTMEEWDAAARRTRDMEDAVINLFNRFQVEREQFEVVGEPVEAGQPVAVTS